MMDLFQQHSFREYTREHFKIRRAETLLTNNTKTETCRTFRKYPKLSVFLEKESEILKDLVIQSKTNYWQVVHQRHTVISKYVDTTCPN